MFAGVRVVGVSVSVYARTHTQTTWVLDMCPVVRRTPGELWRVAGGSCAETFHGDGHSRQYRRVCPTHYP